jgi:transglutaminase-like putative cysteine protease
MRDLVKKSDNYRIVKNTAAYLIKDIDPRNKPNQIRAIFNYVQTYMRYVADIAKVEEITAPWLHLAKIAKQGWSFGDCDDFATLTAALLRSVGFQMAFSAIATGRKGELFDHVRAQVKFNDQWLPLEATAKGREPGWTLPKVKELVLEL